MKRWRGIARAIRGNKQGGYTITEVLIVLAMTTLLFAATVVIMAGRQRDEQYAQSVRTFEAQLQTMIDQVFNGNYDNSISCVASGVGGAPTLGTGTSNGSCVFMGKLFQAETDEVRSRSTNIFGRRTVGSGTGRHNATTLAEAAPVVSTDSVSYEHSFQLHITKMVRADNGAELRALGFMVPLAGSASITSGGRQLELRGIATGQGITTAGNTLNIAAFQALPGGAVICLRDDTRFAEVEIGRRQASQSMVYATLRTRNEGVCLD